VCVCSVCVCVFTEGKKSVRGDLHITILSASVRETVVKSTVLQGHREC